MISFLLWAQEEFSVLLKNEKRRSKAVQKGYKIIELQKDKVQCSIDRRGQFSDFLTPIAGGNLDSYRKALPSTELSVRAKLR
jgi:hypothetical protein